MQALDAGTASVLPEGLRAELEQLEDSGSVRHLNDLKEQIQASCHDASPLAMPQRPWPCRSIPAHACVSLLSDCWLHTARSRAEHEVVYPGPLHAAVTGNGDGDLQREAKEDAELRERHRAAWRRPASPALNAKFVEKIAGERRTRCMCTRMG